MIHGVGVGGPGGRKVSDLPQDPGKGHRHPHLFKSNAQTLVRLGRGEGASPRTMLRLPPHLFSPHGRRKCLQATPCTFHCPAQKGTMHDCSPPTHFGVTSIAPHVHATQEALPQRQSAQEGYDIKGCGTVPPFIVSIPVSPRPSHHCRKWCQSGPVLTMTHGPLPPISAASRQPRSSEPTAASLPITTTMLWVNELSKPAPISHPLPRVGCREAARSMSL